MWQHIPIERLELSWKQFAMLILNWLLLLLMIILFIVQAMNLAGKECWVNSENDYAYPSRQSFSGETNVAERWHTWFVFNTCLFVLLLTNQVVAVIVAAIRSKENAVLFLACPYVVLCLVFLAYTLIYGG